MRAAALTIAAGIALACAPAAAQDLPTLRGAVAEEDINNELLGGAASQSPFGDEEEARPRQSRQQRRAAAAQAAEAEEASAATRTSAVTSEDPQRNQRAAPDAIRTGAIEGRGAGPEEYPFDPVGLRLGTFTVRPRLDQGIGWTSNANSSEDGKSSTYSETALRLNAISDWSRHSATVDADLNWRKSISGEKIDEPEGGVNGELRLDLGGDINAVASAGYRVREESASSPSLVAGVADRPLRHTLTGTVGVTRDIARFRFGLTGDVSRNFYGDAKLDDGSVVSQAERDSTLATARLRLGYEISPAIRPFVEAEAGRRFYDETRDSAGYERSADRYALRTGVELDLREKLTGEISGGWLTERPDDDRLASISGFVTAGRLSWSPVRGTSVDLNAATEVEGTTSAGETGSLLYTGSVEVNHQLRSNLTGRAAVGLEYRDYAASDAHDTVLWGEAGLTWWLNRYAGITGRARHEVQRSNLPGRDYDETSVYLGMTFQR